MYSNHKHHTCRSQRLRSNMHWWKRHLSWVPPFVSRLGQSSQSWNFVPFPPFIMQKTFFSMHRDSSLIKSRDPPFQSASKRKATPLSFNPHHSWCLAWDDDLSLANLLSLIAWGRTAFLARISPIKAGIFHQIVAVSIYQKKCQTSGEESVVRPA